jgi:hypothetical protein
MPPIRAHSCGKTLKSLPLKAPGGEGYYNGTGTGTASRELDTTIKTRSEIGGFSLAQASGHPGNLGIRF